MMNEWTLTEAEEYAVALDGLAYFAHNPVHNCYDRASDKFAFVGPMSGRDGRGEREFSYSPTFIADRNASDDELAELDPQFK
jgi:hypothetical protein